MRRRPALPPIPGSVVSTPTAVLLSGVQTPQPRSLGAVALWVRMAVTLVKGHIQLFKVEQYVTETILIILLFTEAGTSLFVVQELATCYLNDIPQTCSRRRSQTQGGRPS